MFFLYEEQSEGFFFIRTMFIWGHLFLSEKSDELNFLIFMSNNFQVQYVFIRKLFFCMRNYMKNVNLFMRQTIILLFGTKRGKKFMRKKKVISIWGIDWNLFFIRTIFFCVRNRVKNKCFSWGKLFFLCVGKKCSPGNYFLTRKFMFFLTRNLVKYTFFHKEFPVWGTRWNFLFFMRIFFLNGEKK